MDFKITGMNDLMANLEALPHDLDRALTRNMNQLGNEWLNDCRNETPTGTPGISDHPGNLRRGFRLIPVDKRDGDFSVTIYNEVKYAAAVEFGHRQEPGRYVPAIGKCLKRSWVPGYHMLDRSRQRAFLTVGKAARRAIDEVNNGFS